MRTENGLQREMSGKILSLMLPACSNFVTTWSVKLRRWSVVCVHQLFTSIDRIKYAKVFLDMMQIVSDFFPLTETLLLRSKAGRRSS